MVKYDEIIKLAEKQSIPKFVEVNQKFDKSYIEPKNIPKVISDELDRCGVCNNLMPGSTVAITCGSRGIANIALITKSIGDYFLSKNMKPFVTAAMGSHGGATAEGQLAILNDYGVNENYLGFPVKSSMQTVKIGKTLEGQDVLIDKNAFQADAIFVAGRIKDHTAFEGKYESGIMKMLTIGLGKQEGAELVHESGFGTAHKTIPMVANVILENTNVIGALGIVENAFDETFLLKAMLPNEIQEIEPKLLDIAKEKIGKILLPEIDVLIVDEIGKDISGDGMDPNVTGRFGTPYKKGGLIKQRIVVLDLTDKTHGNFNGLGLADVTTQRVLKKAKIDETYPNAITSTVVQMVKMPLVMPTDRLAIQIGIKTCNQIDRENPRIIRIKNTMSLETIQVSEALISEVKLNEQMEIRSDLFKLPFDQNGNLI